MGRLDFSIEFVQVNGPIDFRVLVGPSRPGWAGIRFRELLGFAADEFKTNIQ